MALCGTLAAPEAGAARGTGGGPSISFHAPREAQIGARVTAQGRVARLDGRATIQVQLRRNGKWRTIARLVSGNGRFTIALRLPKQGVAVVLRGAVVVGGHRLAVSAPDRVSLATPARKRKQPAPTPPPATSSDAPPTASPAPPSPPADPEPPVELGPEPSIKPSSTSLYWGAWIDPGPRDQPAPVNLARIDAFEYMVGKRPSILESYSAFFKCDDGSGGACSGEYGFPEEQLETIRQRGAIPLFTWASESSSGQVEQSNFQLADVAAGKWDTYIRRWAEAARAWSHPFFLRFNWEMNGNWYPWGLGVNGNQPGDYIAAWQHVHRIFTDIGATNATWVWCPFVGPRPTRPFYPGDEYVDWTCLDGYNRVIPEQVGWRSFSQIFKPSYKEITEEIAPTKPMLIAETASAEKEAPPGQSKAQWIEAMFAALPVEFPAVRGLLWFNYEEDEKTWPLETSPGSEDAFAAGIANPLYLAGSETGPLTLP